MNTGTGETEIHAPQHADDWVIGDGSSVCDGGDIIPERNAVINALFPKWSKAWSRATCLHDVMSTAARQLAGEGKALESEDMITLSNAILARTAPRAKWIARAVETFQRPYLKIKRIFAPCIAVLLLTGCATLPDIPVKWLDPEPTAANADAVQWEDLRWEYGGEEPGERIVQGGAYGITCTGTMLTFSGLELPFSPERGVVAIFLQKDGGWIGGKFDWAGNPGDKWGKPRPLGHLANYKGWSETLPLAKGTPVAVVVYEHGGKARSRITTTTAQ